MTSITAAETPGDWRREALAQDLQSAKANVSDEDW